MRVDEKPNSGAAINPLANKEQLAAEQTVARVLQLPEIVQARQKVGFLWRLAYGEHASAQAWESFESAMDEYVTNYVIKGVASDEQHPRFVRNFMPPHRWFGREVAGSRIGGDNPDNCYRLAGIAHGTCYEVRGRVIGTAPAHASFTLVANYGTSVTVQTLEFTDIKRDADGSFVITIDDEPADGRVNHLRTQPSVKFLFVRDTMGDWASETPLAIEITRLGEATADPLDDAEIAARAAFRMTEEVPLYYWFSRLCSAKPVNTQSVSASGGLGGLHRQAGSQGWFRVADDEAVVMTLDTAGASYSSIVSHDWWFRTTDYWAHTTSLTDRSAVPDADGRFTFVISKTDPGVHNWIDTCGLNETLVLCRWQGLPQQQLQQLEKGPALSVPQLVKHSELGRLLPKDSLGFTPQQRARQLEERASAFSRRLLEK